MKTNGLVNFCANIVESLESDNKASRLLQNTDLFLGLHMLLAVGTMETVGTSQDLRLGEGSKCHAECNN